MPEPNIPSAVHASPLSFAQETMLFWDKLAPNNAVYNVPIALCLNGPLDQPALAKSIDLIISRHDSLRSRFYFDHGEPTAVIAPPAEGELGCIDLSHIPIAQRADAVQDAANTEARRPFQLSTDSMLRAMLLRVSEAEHILVLTMHHIAADGWSVGVLLNELSQAYPGFTGAAPNNLRRVPIQYGDFARWQREMLHTSAADRCISFWKQQLDGVACDHDLLPLDRSRPLQQSFCGATLRTNLAGTALSEFAAVAQLRRASAFMFMVAALQALLHLYSGYDDILIGVPVANRARSEFEPLIGCFINMVTVRTDLSGNPTFLDLLSRVRESALAAFLHPDVPFSEVVRNLRPKRSPSRTPWFQTQLVFQSYPMPEISWPGVSARRFEVDTNTSKFDLSVLVEMKDGLEIAFEYNTDLFDGATMRRMLDDFSNLLQRMVKHPESRLHVLSARAAAG
jgi:Condensation domain